MLSIYIVEEDHEVLVELINQINANKEYRIVGMSRNGLEFRKNIGEIVKSDIVLIDETVPGITPVGIMSAITTECVKKPSGARGIRAIMSDNITPKVTKRYIDIGYNAVVDKKAPLFHELDKLSKDFYSKQMRIPNYDKYIFYPINIPEFHKYLSEILHSVGIPSSLKGYLYLKRAIEIAFLCIDTVVGGITKIIYPAVAECYKTTSSRVERAMRHAIETGWLRGNVDTIEQLFSYSYSYEKGKPTNGEFIANIADHLAVKFRNEQRAIVDDIEGNSFLDNEGNILVRN